MDIRDVIEQVIKPQIKQPLWENWYIKEKIGSGSFSVVYRIEAQRPSGLDVSALKVEAIMSDKQIFTDSFRKTTFLNSRKQMAINEAQIMKKLRDCPYIVRYEEEYMQELYINGEFEGYYYLIRMEFLQNVYDLMKKGWFPYSEENVKKLAIEIGQGLHAAHSIGVIHRDIKPDNMFVSDAGIYKLGDFNISKKAVSTRTYAGTQYYMAPEIYRARTNIDASYTTQADIYSFGLCLYQMMNNGQLPFEDKLDPDTAYDKRMSGPVNFPPPCNGTLEFIRIILKACSFNPNERYRSVNDMLMELNGKTQTTANITEYANYGYYPATGQGNPNERYESVNPNATAYADDYQSLYERYESVHDRMQTPSNATAYANDDYPTPRRGNLTEYASDDDQMPPYHGNATEYAGFDDNYDNNYDQTPYGTQATPVNPIYSKTDTIPIKLISVVIAFILLVIGIALGIPEHDESDHESESSDDTVENEQPSDRQNHIMENTESESLSTSTTAEESTISSTIESEQSFSRQNYMVENTEAEVLTTVPPESTTITINPAEEIPTNYIIESEPPVNQQDYLPEEPNNDIPVDPVEEVIVEGNEPDEPDEPVVQNPSMTIPHLSDYSSHISDITSSSHLANETYGNTTYVHSAEQAFDNDLSTCWSEGVDGYGVGESITVFFDNTYEISEFSLYNSLCTNEDLFYKNTRLQSISVILSNGNSYDFECADGWENRNNTFSFGENVETSSLTIIIQSVYAGNKYEDTCISEISIS